MKRLLSVLALAALATGCYTVKTAESPILGPDVESHVYIRNKGWNILGCVPLLCGNKNMDSWCPFVLFRNDTKLEIAKDKLVKLAAEKNCDICDVTYIDDSRVLVSFFNIDIPWLVQTKIVEVSATLVKKPAGVPQNEEVAK